MLLFVLAYIFPRYVYGMLLSHTKQAVDSCHIYFTDRTPLLGTFFIQPFVRTSTLDAHTRLSSTVIVGLCSIPVGVSHDGHFVTARVCRRQAPDERRLEISWVNALP